MGEGEAEAEAKAWGVGRGKNEAPLFADIEQHPRKLLVDKWENWPYEDWCQITEFCPGDCRSEF